MNAFIDDTDGSEHWDGRVNDVDYRLWIKGSGNFRRPSRRHPEHGYRYGPWLAAALSFSPSAALLL